MTSATFFVPAGVLAGTSSQPLPESRKAALTLSGILVKKGHRLAVTAHGVASGGPNFHFFDATGAPPGSQEFSGPRSGGEFPLISGSAANIYSLICTFAALKAILTDSGAEWFSVGVKNTITADRDGELILLFNDALYRADWAPAYLDNTGGFCVNVVDA